jgi:transposase-like protein
MAANMGPEPKSLQEAILYFSDLNNCIDYLAIRRWPKGVVCPSCGSDKVKFNPSRRVWQCSTHHAKRQFSVKVGTIYEDSPIGLDKWLMVTWMLINCKNDVSSYEIARSIKVTQKSAWFMLHRIRLAMSAGSFDKIDGIAEIDETFIGGKARNMHKAERARKITGTGGKDKTIVVGALERGGKVRATVVEDRTRETLHGFVREHVAEGATVYTDALTSYTGLNADFEHETVDHAIAYVDGQVHSNGIENFWALLKRGLHGTYISVEPFHLFRYLDERVFTFNMRELTDLGRFTYTLGSVANRRLTYTELTGKAHA